MCWPVSFFQRAPQRFIRISNKLLQVASTLPLPSAKTQSARSGIIHAIGLAAMAFEIRDRLMDRMICAHTFIAARSDQFLQNIAALPG